MSAAPEGPQRRGATVIRAAILGAVAGYLAGWFAFTIREGIWADVITGLSHALAGRGGESVDWGEALVYGVAFVFYPSGWHIGGALIGTVAGALASRKRPRPREVMMVLLLLILLSRTFVWAVARDRREREEIAGEGLPTPLEAAREKCKAGDGPSCTFVGDLYQDERLGHDFRLALDNYERGCGLGDARACHKAGVILEHGRGVVRADAVRALALYKQSCDRRYAEGCRALAMAQYSGVPGVPQNLTQAVAGFQRACTLGEAWSCFQAGMMYERAEGVRQNFTQAAAFYAKACEAHSGIGCQSLGDSYLHGEGVSRDEVRARDLYLQSATLLDDECSRGVAYSCYALGLMYKFGRGVAVDVRRAQELLEKGCRGGNADACAQLLSLK